MVYGTEHVKLAHADGFAVDPVQKKTYAAGCDPCSCNIIYNGMAFQINGMSVCFGCLICNKQYARTINSRDVFAEQDVLFRYALAMRVILNAVWLSYM